MQSETGHIKMSCLGVLDRSLHKHCLPACLTALAVGPSKKCLIALKNDQPMASGHVVHCYPIANRFPVTFVETYWSSFIHWDTKTLFLILSEGSTIQHELARIMWNCSLWFTYLCKGFFWDWILLLMFVKICPGLVIIATFCSNWRERAGKHLPTLWTTPLDYFNALSLFSFFLPHTLQSKHQMFQSAMQCQPTKQRENNK